MSAISALHKNRVEFHGSWHDFHDKWKHGASVMNETRQDYLIFETAGGFCGIAWSDIGVIRFQLRIPARRRLKSRRSSPR
jgi:hypothetical protein